MVEHHFENRCKARVKNRGGGGGYSEFEPIHQRSDEDDEEEETASLTSGRTYSSMSSSSTASGASQMVILSMNREWAFFPVILGSEAHDNSAVIDKSHCIPKFIVGICFKSAYPIPIPNPINSLSELNF